MSIIKKPKTPQSETIRPKIRKKFLYETAPDCANEPTPITAAIDKKPTNVRAVSTVGRIFGVVTSVTQALNAASLLAEPINVITMSIRITTHTVVPRILASSERLKSAETPSLVINPKDAVTSPHNK